jgi:Mg2+/citrate symporter
MTSIIFAMIVVIFFYILDGMKEDKKLYDIMISAEENAEIRQQIQDVYETSKKKNNKYIVVTTILMLLAFVVSVIDIIEVISKHVG